VRHSSAARRGAEKFLVWFTKMTSLAHIALAPYAVTAATGNSRGSARVAAAGAPRTHRCAPRLRGVCAPGQYPKGLFQCPIRRRRPARARICTACRSARRTARTCTARRATRQRSAARRGRAGRRVCQRLPGTPPTARRAPLRRAGARATTLSVAHTRRVGRASAGVRARASRHDARRLEGRKLFPARRPRARARASPAPRVSVRREAS
jgi:hypothetical protein